MILYRKKQNLRYLAQNKTVMKKMREQVNIWHIVKQLSTQNFIPSILDGKDKLITDGKEINKIFTNFYQELYTSQGEVPIENYDRFFSSLQIPCLSTFDRDSLENDITL